MRLLVWADQNGGWKLFGSSTAFRLSDGSVLSPDASLQRLDRWHTLSSEEWRGFALLCPELVVKLASTNGASPSVEGPRGLSALRRKMSAYQVKCARLGWLLIPQVQAVEVWTANEELQRLDQAAADSPGQPLQLAETWAGRGIGGIGSGTNTTP